jgi:hypothetical protein
MNMKRLSLIFILIVFTVSYVNAAWVFNGGDSGDGKENTGSLIIDGAANFLQSYSNILLLLNESELSPTMGFDFSIAGSYVDTAIRKLKVSREKYALALWEMKQTTFSSLIIQKLIDFDYDKLVEERDLNPCTMKQVSVYLSKGDVSGLYERAVKDLDALLMKLTTVQAYIRKNVVPEIEDLRALYQQYSGFMQSGYYSSLIFSEVSK